MMTNSILILIMYLVLVGTPGQCQFVRSRQGLVLNGNSHYLGLGAKYPIPDGGMAFWARDRDSLYPGDYYLWPDGADTTLLTSLEFSEISRVLHSFIKAGYYDSLNLTDITGFAYAMAGEKVKRREYYIRYSCGDTIFVISGWLGKFLSFYRAVPGNQGYSLSQLREVAAEVLASDFSFDYNEFKTIGEGNESFKECYDRPHLERLRSYSIREIPYNAWIAGKILDQRPYTLIELTKFLDEDIIP